MSKVEKILLAVLSGTSDSNIKFGDLQNLLENIGFECNRVNGSHHVYVKDKVEEIINRQPNGSKAKPYQVKQIRNIILKYKLAR
jgi:predicted RNA binding protein YcfA (HicA-like mRNA interferase family)